MTMATMIVEAIYQQGMIKPLTELGLRENERVRIAITHDPGEQAELKKVISLRGIWKNQALVDEEGDWITDTVVEIRRESAQKVETIW